MMDDENAETVDFLDIDEEQRVLSELRNHRSLPGPEFDAALRRLELHTAALRRRFYWAVARFGDNKGRT